MTVTLRNGTTVHDDRLDRLPSLNYEHFERYPLTLDTMPMTPRPMLAGVNWYSKFDDPVEIKTNGRRYSAVGAGSLGHIRGGHAFCLKPLDMVDPYSWWDYYNQGVEGRCVEFGKLRMMSLLNRRRYDITSHWHYWTDQMADEWGGGSYPGAVPQYEGTSGRAGLDGLLKRGVVRAAYRGAPISFEQAGSLARMDDGIAAYRWALNWADVRAVTGVPDWLPGVPFLNSWGRDYPHMTLLLDDAGARILAEDGEFGVVTDR